MASTTPSPLPVVGEKRVLTPSDTSEDRFIAHAFVSPIAAHKKARNSPWDGGGRVAFTDVDVSAQARLVDKPATFYTPKFLRFSCQGISGGGSVSAAVAAVMVAGASPVWPPAGAQPQDRCKAVYASGVKAGHQCQAPAMRYSTRWAGLVCGTHSLGGLPNGSEEKMARARERARKSRAAKKEKKKGEAAAEAARAAPDEPGGPGVADEFLVGDLVYLEPDEHEGHIGSFRIGGLDPYAHGSCVEGDPFFGLG